MKHCLLFLGLVVALSLTVAAVPRQSEKPSSVQELVAAEKAFAKYSVENGMREAFIEFFTDEGINFVPQPVLTREFLKKRPPTPKPLPFILDWTPMTGDIARSGDLGYNTGPFMVTVPSQKDQKPSFGYFFSIWKKQADGTWKVVVDAGVQSEEAGKRPLSEVVYQQTPIKTVEVPAKSINPGQEKEGLLAADKSLTQATQTKSRADSYKAVLLPKSRLHLNDLAPLANSDQILAYLKAHPGSMTGTVTHSDLSKAADFGYTVGSYEFKPQTGDKPEKGSYVRIWRRVTRNDWKLAFETFLPLPPEN